MTLVLISAAYGAGGGRVAPAVAQRLGVPFVDRAIPMEVAERLEVSVDEATAHDDRIWGNWLERVLAGFVGGDAGMPTLLPADTLRAEDFREATEAVLMRQAATGEGVILGRGGAIVLRDHPQALRVRLSGPPQRRIEQAVSFEGVDRAGAERAQRRLDHTHSVYAKHFYGVDRDDPTLYHLMLDSTSIPLETCVEVIVQAARGLSGSPDRAEPEGAAGAVGD